MTNKLALVDYQEESDLESELEDSKMSFTSHLTELRKRLFNCVAALIIGTLVCFQWADELFEILRQPLTEIQRQELIVIGLLEMFVTHLKIAVLAGVFLTSPWILAQVWAFVAPGLYQREKRWTIPFVGLGTVFFISGGLFAFLVVMPMGFEYLVMLVPNTVSPQLSVQLYFNLVVRLLLAFGIVFELPLAMWIFSAAGILGPKLYIKGRKYFLVLSVIIAAFLTPPDPFTQLMMAIPLVLFYELGIMGAKLLYRDPGDEVPDEPNERESPAEEE